MPHLKLNRISPTKSPWITTVLKKRMTFRDQLKKKSYQNPKHVHLELISKSKKSIKSGNEGCLLYNNPLNKYTGDQRMNWKTINKLTSRKSNKTLLNEEK